MVKTDNELGESFDNTLELTMEAVKEKTARGAVVLIGRTFFLQIFTLIVGIFLGIVLDPADFGVFIIVSAVVNFLAYFSDVGLGAALIQSKEKVTEVDLRTTFAVQQALVFSIVAILFILTPYLRNIYELNQDGVYLIYALGASLLMASFKTIPSVLLERNLEFTKWMVPQVLENLVYNTVVLILAWKGYGVMSFTYAVLARGAVGLVVIYILRPWLPRYAFSRKSLHRLLKFGVPYQVNTFLASIKDDGLTAFLGGVLGATQMGYLGWAQKWAKYPLRLFMDNVIKVSFPAFSKMQDEKEHLGSSVTKSIFFLCFLVFPSLVGFLILAPMLVQIIPRYEKWIPALIPLYILGIDTIFATVTTQLTNTLNAIGKISKTFKLMVMWTTLAWLIIPFLAVQFGFVGASVGYALVSSSSVVAIVFTKRYVDFSIKEASLYPAIATVIMAIILLLGSIFLDASTSSVIVLGVVGFVVYMAMMRLLVGVAIIDDVKRVTKNLYGK